MFVFELGSSFPLRPGEPWGEQKAGRGKPFRWAKFMSAQWEESKRTCSAHANAAL